MREKKGFDFRADSNTAAKKDSQIVHNMTSRTVKIKLSVKTYLTNDSAIKTKVFRVSVPID